MTEVALPVEVRQEFLAVFEHHGVDPAAWDALLEKVARGELPDADSGQIDPVSSTRTIVDGIAVIRHVYPDGSVSLTSAPTGPAKPVRPLSSTPGAVTPLAAGSVSECSTSSAAGYTYYNNCRIVYDGISFSYSFRANFRTKSGTNRR
ncbi:hypothetical protein [Cellulomonas septica]|uniref:Uncharacterized protein n=1 Tax=Cellulomonas septica TaxID=285080 RepID=A0ABX1K2W7_9CELL|nr:hypothetical protein [Cellulomonas septica]NKY40903.1 hypothetical protein [Cellulomonas septica]